MSCVGVPGGAVSLGGGGGGYNKTATWAMTT